MDQPPFWSGLGPQGSLLAGLCVSFSRTRAGAQRWHRHEQVHGGWRNGGSSGTAVHIAVRCGRGGSLQVTTLNPMTVQPDRVDGRVKEPMSAEELK